MKVDHTCEYCEKSTKEELYTRAYMIQVYGITWVCEKCFKKLENCTFDGYNIKEIKDEDNDTGI